MTPGGPMRASFVGGITVGADIIRPKKPSVTACGRATSLFKGDKGVGGLYMVRVTNRMGPPQKPSDSGFCGERTSKGTQRGMPTLGRPEWSGLCEDEARRVVAPYARR